MKALLRGLMAFAFSLTLGPQPAWAQSPIMLMGTCAQTEPLLKHACGCTVEKALAAGFKPAEVARLVKLDLMSVSPDKQQKYFAIKGQCLAETDPSKVQAVRATPAPAPGALPAQQAPAARQTAATAAPTRTSSNGGSGITPLFMCQRLLAIVGDKCPCMVDQLKKGGIPDSVAARLFGGDGRTATPAQADQFNRIVKGCSGYRTAVKGTATGTAVASTAAPASRPAASRQPAARAGACLVPPVMTGPPAGLDPGDPKQRVVYVSDNQMRGQLAALEGTRWRYTAVGMMGNEMAQWGETDTELLFGPDRVVTQRFISEKKGTTEYRYRAIVVDEEPGLDRKCDRGAYALPDGTFASSGEGGRAIRRQLVLRPLDSQGFETEMAIGYWGGKTLYVGDNVRWQYYVTPATLLSGTPKPVKPLPRGAAATRPSGPLSVRVGELGGLPKDLSYNCDTMIWRQTDKVRTARQLAALKDKGALQLVAADLTVVEGERGADQIVLMRLDGQDLKLAVTNAGGQTVWNNGNWQVTQRSTGQYNFPDEPGIGFGDGVLTVRHGSESLTIPFVSRSVC